MTIDALDLCLQECNNKQGDKWIETAENPNEFFTENTGFAPQPNLMLM